MAGHATELKKPRELQCPSHIPVLHEQPASSPYPLKMSSAPAIPTPPAPTAVPVSSEDVVARKFDNCLADMLVSTGIGFSVGVVASVLIFRRRGWPVALSTGFGAGVAYQNCNTLLNPYALPGTKILPPSSVSAPAMPEKLLA